MRGPIQFIRNRVRLDDKTRQCIINSVTISRMLQRGRKIRRAEVRRMDGQTNLNWLKK